MNIGIGIYQGAYGAYMQPGNTSVNSSAAGSTDAVKGIDGKTDESRAAKRAGKVECQTCKERKYQDGSDEMVSFKSAAHISPQAAGSAVRAHEQEHVSNAFKKAAEGNGKVLQASVKIKTAVCPECGRSYVAGGTTNTKIRYNEKNPYEKNAKSNQAEAMKGNAVDLAV